MLNFESTAASAKPSRPRLCRNVVIDHIPGTAYFVDGRRFKGRCDVWGEYGHPEGCRRYTKAQQEAAIRSLNAKAEANGDPSMWAALA